MPNRDTFVQLANRLFTVTFADFMRPGVYKQNGNPEYVPGEGPITTSIQRPVIGPFIGWTNDEINGDTIQVGDRKYLVRADELGLTPRIDDLTFVEDSHWYVKYWRTDPGNVIVTLGLRKRPA